MRAAYVWTVCRNVICIHFQKKRGLSRPSAGSRRQRRRASSSWAANLPASKVRCSDGRGVIIRELFFPILTCLTQYCLRDGMIGVPRPSTGAYIGGYRMMDIASYIILILAETPVFLCWICLVYVVYSTVFYGQYKCYGPGARTSERVEWSRSLTSEEAAPFLTKDLIGGKSWIRPVPTHFKRPLTPTSYNLNGNT